MFAQVLEAILLRFRLGCVRLDRMLRGNFSCDAGVLGSVDGVRRLLLLGITLVLTIGRLVIHFTRCQPDMGVDPFSIFLFQTE
jgi:hypothetical protein